MKNAERVTGTKKMFREKRFLQKKRLLAVLLLTVLSICLVGGCGSKPVSTQDADILSSYIGFWRYEGTPTYVTINDQYQWATTDFYGNQQDSGVITTDENGLNLSRADGSFVSTLAVTDTGLVDGGGEYAGAQRRVGIFADGSRCPESDHCISGKFWKCDHQLSGADECLSICVLYRLSGI